MRTDAVARWTLSLVTLVLIAGTANGAELSLPDLGPSIPALAQNAAAASDSSPSTLDSAVDAAKDAGRTFQQQLLGQSLTLGGAYTLTGATLTTKGGTFETYDGPSTLAPFVAFNSASASGLVTGTSDVGGFHFTDTISFAANYAGFNADKQTVQKLIGGKKPEGFVHGDYLYGVGLFAYNGIHDGDIPWSFRVGAGVGMALAWVAGRVDYAAGGVNHIDTFSQGFDQPMLTYVLLAEGRVGHIVFSEQAVQLYDQVQTKQTKTKFLLDMAVVTFQVGYAANL